MRRFAVLSIVVASICLATSCGPVSSTHFLKTAAQPSPFVIPLPPIGDKCLIGKWTMQQEVNTSGYSFENTTVPVSGLRGATVTFGQDGSETKVFDGSQPLVGSFNGQTLAITVRGSAHFTVHASQGTFAETGTRTQLPTTATLGGSPVNYHSSTGPGTGQYVCSSSRLSISYGSVQTDSYSYG